MNRHTSLVAGRPVLMAGEMQVVNGEVKLINRQSGHYMPTENHAVLFQKFLEKNGVNLNQASVDLSLPN